VITTVPASTILTAVLLAALTAGLGAPPRAAWADGSDNMGPNVHVGPFLAATSCTPGLGICQGLRLDTLLRVDILEDGERFVWTGLGDVTVTSPTGEAVNGADGDNLYGSGETINPLAGVGAYRLRLAEQQFQCTERPATSFCTSSDQIHTFHRWDVTVFDGDVPRPGRLWSLAWNFNAGNFTANQATTASFYALVPGGFAATDAVVELRLDGLAGFLYQVAANRQGPQSADLLSRGRSLPQLEATLFPEFPVYLNVPEIARYGRVDDAAIDVSEFQCNAGPPSGGAIPRTFRFDTNVTGTFQVLCDLDDPPDGASLTDDDDLVLIGPAAPGNNVVPWDGLDGNGNPVPLGSYSCVIRVTVGEFHYVAADIETSFPGMRMFEVEEDQDRRPLRMFWNDTAVQAGGATMANAETSPVTSPQDGLLSGTGPATAFSVENPDGNARAWGQFHPSGISKGDMAYLDTFAWVAATEGTLVGCTDVGDDTNPPLVVPPPDITVEATGPLTPVDLGTATATDPEDGPLTPTPDTTGPFPVGATVVTWSATDAAGNTGTATQRITVVDTTPPEVVAPPDVTVLATGGLTVVDLQPALASAVDLVDGPLTPTPGTTGPFPLGTTLVTWSATDAAGNTGSAVQRVEVIAAAVADLRILSFAVVHPPHQVLVGHGVPVTLRAKIINSGPFGPVNTQLTLTATPPPGSSVDPPAVIIAQPALGAGEVRTVHGGFTINCAAAGRHTFGFGSELTPIGAIDPAPGNNHAATQIVVECVVPVVINIKPGSNPNSIQTRKGTIPVAILTTVAGEGGTPLAFDATTVDPRSVRFGPRKVVLSGTGGAAESHGRRRLPWHRHGCGPGRGHLEDSFELDEVTRDGDLDMVLHFEAAATGIRVGDTEACVKGRFRHGGRTLTFFGCDAVRVVR
jgi:hypothetical protein